MDCDHSGAVDNFCLLYCGPHYARKQLSSDVLGVPGRSGPGISGVFVLGHPAPAGAAPAVLPVGCGCFFLSAADHRRRRGAGFDRGAPGDHDDHRSFEGGPVPYKPASGDFGRGESGQRGDFSGHGMGEPGSRQRRGRADLCLYQGPAEPNQPRAVRGRISLRV